MTPKEEAEELVNKMLDTLYDNGGLSFKRILYGKAVQCALVAIDAILDGLSTIPYGIQYLSARDYYQEVKEEIEKIKTN
jgi:hypothetical protein